MATSAPQRSTSPDDIAALVRNRKVVVASNRGPVEFARESSGKLTTRRGSGGVVTALATLAQQLPLTWVAATMTDADREAFSDEHAASREVRLGRQPLRVRYVNVPPDVYTRHYDEVSNELLWFLQHYLWDPANSPTFTERQYEAWDHGYRPVNYAIAQAVVREILETSSTGKARGRAPAGSDAIILLQDYHLYLAPAFVRQRLPRATIEQFIHIPWPSLRYWQFLPERFLLEIYEGLAANDVLGFQTELDARNFLECARVVLPGSRVDLDQGRLLWRRHRLLARAYPITVDADEVIRTLASAPGRMAAQELGAQLSEAGHVIVRVDRMEPAKNIVRGLLAYEALLRRHPELRGAVRHLAFLVPSRQGLKVYQRYEREVKRLIARINAEFGGDGWEPITPYIDNNRARALAAMRRYDALLVNPVIDGMNLVAKEGAIANEHDGVIILSRTAGAYQQLAEAVLPVTCTDVEETAEQLYEALAMPARERQQRAEKARAIVNDSSLTQWILDQLCDAASARLVPSGGANGRSLARAG
jgi:trehalose 6-phosphate synthase